MTVVEVAFTGSQDGMTNEQAGVVETFLSGWDVGVFRHGDCIGADAIAHDIAIGLSLNIEIHPTNIPGKRAFCEGASYVHEVLPPIMRNHVMVDRCPILIATPATMYEIVRSGTWATIRYARKMKRLTYVVLRDGTVIP